jgi:glycerol transport system ATP-binding protein
MTQGLTIAGLTRIVDREMHVADVDMTFAPASFTVLLGRSRAGKTSLLRLLAGLDRPTAGRVLWDGRDITEVDVRSRDVAMVYQQFVNYPSLTVYENIASPLRIQKKLGRGDIDRRVRETAALLRLDGLLERLPQELSGGQQQRTAIARALAKDAKLLLLDEPLANLDYKLREELRSELATLFQGRDGVVVYATAEPNEALQLGGRTAVLDEGRVAQIGRALDVYGAPASERVAQIFSDPEMNLLDAEVTASGTARVNDAVAFGLPEQLRALPPGRYRLGVRANHVRLQRSTEADLVLPAVALLQEVSGSETLLHASFGQSTVLAQIPGVHRRTLGERLDLFVAPTRLFAFDAHGRLAARALAPSTSSASVGRKAEGHGAH